MVITGYPPEEEVLLIKFLDIHKDYMKAIDEILIDMQNNLGKDHPLNKNLIKTKMIEIAFDLLKNACSEIEINIEE